jgi:hypothetical protein
LRAKPFATTRRTVTEKFMSGPMPAMGAKRTA